MLRRALVVMGILVAFAGCDSRNTARTVFGRASVENLEAICIGKITLTQGSAAVRDSCFSGETNIVLCTNESHPNPVRCKATTGMLTIESGAGDVIDYARIR